MQQNLFTEGEMTTSRPTITKPNVSRSTFYQGDCLVEMDKIADKSIDMILCDLPYGTTACKWDVIIPFDKLWEQYKRIIKDNGAIVLTASQPFTSALIMSNPKMFKYNWTWNKLCPTNHLNSKKQPLRVIEDICVFYKLQSLYNAVLQEKPKHQIRKNNIIRKDKNTSIYGAVKDGFPKYEFRTIPIDKSYPTNLITISSLTKTKLHPSEKPVELMEYLIKTYTNEGQTILDNTMGSGSTGVACRNTNRHFIGIEQDKKYFDIAVKR